MRLAGGHVLLFALVLGGAFGCASDIGVEKNPPEARQLYGADDLMPGHLSPGTVNLLGNFLLADLFEKDPAAVLQRLEELCKQESYRLRGTTSSEPKDRIRDFVCAMADTALAAGLRFRRDPDLSSRYFLAAALYSGVYLKDLDDGEDPYSEERIRLIRICNLATTELYCYLKERRLERSSGFELPLPGGGDRQVSFMPSVYQLPVPVEALTSFTPCCDYQTRNLTHVTRSAGFGVPMVAELKPGVLHVGKDVGARVIPGMPIALTLVPVFHCDLAAERAGVEFRYIYSRTATHVELGKHRLPLCSDFSTPLAKAVSRPPMIDFLERTFRVGEAERFTGLYHFEPFDPGRIPVIFVHGLMSDARTWSQMLNTLLHDPTLRSRYQFLGFAYSSGSPVFLSAARLRRELAALRRHLAEQKLPTEAFDRMVLIGHSMGGLLSRLQVCRCSGKDVAAILKVKDIDEVKRQFTPEAQKRFSEASEFEPSPSVKRVIFIAVPHRGSRIAESWIGGLGTSLIRLPGKLVRRNFQILEDLVRKGKVSPDFLDSRTGIDNLRPDDPMLRLLGALPMAGISYHSIIGNREREGTPGGSDGVVPYESSHLDGAESELVVKSGHSVHCNPLAIQEVRRILLLHAARNGGSAK